MAVTARAGQDHHRRPHGHDAADGRRGGQRGDVENVANFVLSLSGSAHDAVKAELGKPKFAACAACHGAEGKGNPALGAPNLTDKIWLYGGSLAAVVETINKGRSNQMPAFKDLLAPGKIQVLAAYVWSLSNAPKAASCAKIGQHAQQAAPVTGPRRRSSARPFFLPIPTAAPA
jgi:cbb3-type cytochrome c oxidase subunit III